MLERISEKLLSALAALEGLNVEPRSLLLDAKAQGLVLVNLVNSVIERPEEEPLPGEEFLDKISVTIEDYVRLVEQLKSIGHYDR